MVLNPKIRRWLFVAGLFLVAFISFIFLFFQKK